MKKLLYTFIGLLLLASCTSVQELVDKGDYDGAIELAAKKLNGEKNRKTKYVQALETAFEKITLQDLDQIDYLKSHNNALNWDRVYNIAKTMERRQNKIKPFLPLVSKDGYVAHFKFVKTGSLMNEAAEKASALYYSQANALMSQARNGDKSAARDAFNTLDKIGKYDINYMETHVLSQEAHKLGMDHIKVVLVNNSRQILPREFEEDVLSLDVNRLNDLWRTYYVDARNTNINYDYRAVIDIDDIDISPEREYVNRYEEVREIEDGYEYVLDEKGNVKKDTLGNDIKQKKYINIRAWVTEISREKRATVRGFLRVFDIKDESTLDAFPVEVEMVFDSQSARCEGDRRALTSNSRGLVDRNLDPFPRDEQMILDAATEVKRIISNRLVNYSFLPS